MSEETRAKSEAKDCRPRLSELPPDHTTSFSDKVLLRRSVTDEEKVNFRQVCQPLGRIQHILECMRHPVCPEITDYMFLADTKFFGHLFAALPGAISAEINAIGDDRDLGTVNSS